MAATRPTTWRPTLHCCRAPWAPRCGCSSHASKNTGGSPRAPPSSCRCAVGSTPMARWPPTTLKRPTPPTAPRCWRCCTPAPSSPWRRRMKWATAPRARRMRMQTCASPSTTWRPSCGRRGCGACRPCPTRLRMNRMWTNWPPLPGWTRCSFACSCSMTRAPQSWCRPPPTKQVGGPTPGRSS